MSEPHRVRVEGVGMAEWSTLDEKFVEFERLKREALYHLYYEHVGSVGLTELQRQYQAAVEEIEEVMWGGTEE